MIPFSHYFKTILLILIMVMVSGVSYPVITHADYQSDLAKKKAIQDNIIASEKQKKQQQAIADQIQTEIKDLDRQAVATQATIQKISGQISEGNKAIVALNSDISKQITSIQSEKDKLESTISSMYIDDQLNSLPFVIKTDSISEVISQAQDDQAIAHEIELKAQEIEMLRLSLEGKKNELLKKQNGLAQLKDQQVQQKQALEKQTSLKNELLNTSIRTVDELSSAINGYKNDLKVVDGRISDFLAAMQAQSNYKAASGDLVVFNNHPWHYSQTDARWNNQLINPADPESDTFGESGCLLSALAAVASAEGMTLNPVEMRTKLQDAGGMYGDLVGWSGVRQALQGKFDFVTGGKEAINWKLIEISLTSGFPVIVHVNKGRFGHWIVISNKIGDKYAVEDSYFSNGQVYAASSIDYMARLQPI